MQNVWARMKGTAFGEALEWKLPLHLAMGTGIQPGPKHPIRAKLSKYGIQELKPRPRICATLPHSQREIVPEPA